MATTEAMASQELLDRFATEEFPPILDESQQTAMQTYLAQQGLRAGLNILGFDDSQLVKTEIMLSHDSDARRLLDLRPDAIVGPYFLSGVYHAEGLTIWIPDQAA